MATNVTVNAGQGSTQVTVITGEGSTSYKVEAGSRGPAGATGATGANGAAGPNSVTTSTSSNLTGFIAANGTNVSGATAGASAATANTLALRDATGGSNFAAVGASSVTSSGAISTTGASASIGTGGATGIIYTLGSDANIYTAGSDASIFTQGANASISTSGVNGSISTSGLAANIFTTGQLGFISTSGFNADIYTQGTEARIYTAGADASIFTEGANATIFTEGSNAYIQSRSTFKLFNGNHTTTLSHSPTDNRAIAFPNKDGTVAMIDAETHTGAHAFSSTTRPTSAGTGTPAATSLITLADSEDAKRGWMLFHCTNFTGATNVKSGGTGESATLGYCQGSSSATNGNYNGYRFGTYMAMNPSGAISTASFNRRTIFRCSILTQATASVTGEARFLWPVSTSYTTGRLTTKGFGFVVIGNKVYGHTHDGTTARLTTAFVDFGLTASLASCVADSNGSGTVSFYVNGTFLESLTGPTGTQTLARGVQANVECVDSTALFFTLTSFSLEVKN